MRGLSRNLVVVCAIALSCIGCNATEIFRTKRGVVPGNAASRPKGKKKKKCPALLWSAVIGKVLRPRLGYLYLNLMCLCDIDTIRKSECRYDNHCKAWPKTSCGKDPVDGKSRCLCADQTHPINDDCITSPQGNIYHFSQYRALRLKIAFFVPSKNWEWLASGTFNAFSWHIVRITWAKRIQMSKYVSVGRSLPMKTEPAMVNYIFNIHAVSRCLAITVPAFFLQPDFFILLSFCSVTNF